MKKFNQLLILGTTLLLSAAALTGCSGSSAMGATIPQTTSGETATPQTDAGIIASETTGSNNRQRELPGEFKEALQEIEQKMKKIRLKGSFGKRMMEGSF